MCIGMLKTPEQQGIQALHRIREQLKHERTAALNLVRGVLREFGVAIPMGAAKVRAAVLAALEDGDNDLPMALRHTLAEQLERSAGLEREMAAIEDRLQEFARRDVTTQRYRQVPGIGLMTATALRASAGSPARRHLLAHLADPRCTRRAASGAHETATRAGVGSIAGLGAGSATAAGPQQGCRRVGQQTRPQALGHRAPRYPLRSPPRQRALASPLGSKHDHTFHALPG